jgi:hypothetical protein
MKITEHLLSIPPYISTSWKNISSIHMGKEGELEIYLNNGSKISIDHLSESQIGKIFQYHGKSLEESSHLPLKHPFDINMRTGGIVLSGMENFTGMMQHDSSQANGPTLPQELIDKISEMGKAMGIDKSTFNIPEGESHCNCPYCQISRAIHGIEKEDRKLSDLDHEDLNEELTFREWNIHQKNDKLYEVTNPFDENEKYSVYLGDPIGCTCGKNNCEHILAVLKS